MQIQAFSGRYFVLCHNAMTPLWWCMQTVCSSVSGNQTLTTESLSTSSK